MSSEAVGIMGIGLLLILMAAGVHIGVALLVVSFVGSVVIMGVAPALGMLKTAPLAILAEYSFAVIPFFILMGLLAAHGGLSEALYNFFAKWLGRLPGGLAIATAGAQAAFGACCASTIASSVTFTKISLPWMLKRGYSKELSAGVIAAAGTIADLIPPSTLIVIYGIFTEQPIGQLLIAGIIPGILAAFLFMTQLFVRAKSNPSIAPIVEERFSWKDRISSVKGVWGLFVLMAIIMGGIYAGIFTPTEAGACGSFGAFLIALFGRGLGGGKLRMSLLDSVHTSAMIFFIVIGAVVFGRFLALTQLPARSMEFIQASGWPPMIVLVTFLAIYIVLGCFLDAVGMMALTFPVVIPVIERLGFSPIWFGILFIVVADIGLLTPPVGLNVFAVQGSAGGLVSMEECFRGIVPFVVMYLILLAILVAFPEISLFLPRMMVLR